LRQFASSRWPSVSGVCCRVLNSWSAGLSGGTVSRWIERGRLQRFLPGVYALGHRALPTEGRLAAALLYAGPGAALGLATAVWWWELSASRPQATHVVSPCRRRSLDLVRVHYREHVERVRHRGLPVVPIEYALLHLARTRPTRAVLKALADAEYRGLLDVPAIESALGRGRRGSAALRTPLRDHLPELAASRSELEERFLLLCRRSGIPIPEVNVPVGRFLVDALWRSQRVVVELDGQVAHASPAAIERDRRRDLDLRASGYRVLRYTWGQVTGEPGRVAADLAAAI
jgi:hypothetical protein